MPDKILNELIKKVDISFASDNIKMDAKITGISFNSTTTRKGELFIAIKGFSSDGHNFIKDAIKNGAVCIICTEPKDISVPYIVTSDTRKALSTISAAWFENPAEKMKIRSYSTQYL